MYPVALAEEMGHRTCSLAQWTFVLAVAGVAHAAFPPLLGGALKPCARNAVLNECIVESLNDVRPKLKNGVPAAGLPALDALRGRELRVEEGMSDASLRVVFSNFTWGGLDDFVATAARADLNRLLLEIDAVYGRQYLNGKYSFRGKLLTLRVSGDGDFTAYFGQGNGVCVSQGPTGCLLSPRPRSTNGMLWSPRGLLCQGGNITHRLQLEEVQRSGEKFWRVKKYDYDLDMTSFYTDFRNLFGGNKRLGQYFNSFLNRNWRVAFLVYKEVVNRSLGKFIQDEIVDKFFEMVPVNSILYAD